MAGAEKNCTPMTYFTPYLTYSKVLSALSFGCLLAVYTPAQTPPTDGLPPVLSVSNHGTARAPLPIPLVRYPFFLLDLSHNEEHSAVSQSFDRTPFIAELQTQYKTQQKARLTTALAQEEWLHRQKERVSQRLLSLVLGATLLLVLLGGAYIYYRLKKRLNILQGQKQAVEAKNAENEWLIREIHHRVKNNLQIIMSLLNARANKLNDPQVVEVINESRNRIKSMSLIHEKLYQVNNYAQVPVQSYLDEMAHNVAQAYQERVQLHLDVEPVNINVSVAVPLGLMVNELLSNAYKYAFEGEAGARISVVFSAEKANGHRHYHLQIADDGKGLPPDFDLDRSRSFGLRLVKGLIQQLNGGWQVQSSAGTHFTIRFKDVVQTS